MPPTAVILGRPNVGKSTLFNRLTARRSALVDATPGLTRDRRSGQARIGTVVFEVVDTAGLGDASAEGLAARMREQTEAAVAEADLALLVVDARTGVAPWDRDIAGWLRRVAKPIVLVANKCERDGGQSGLLEAFSLGVGEPVAISAEHGEGMGDLADAIATALPEAQSPDGDDHADEGAPLRLAIVGRPNVGKSTLANRLLGEARFVTGPEAGITRDAVASDFAVMGRAVRLVDTAGLRRKARIAERLDKLASGDALRAVRLAHAAVVVVDASAPLDRQDYAIARIAVSEGRAIVLALNKWDLVREQAAAKTAVRTRLARSLPQAKGVAQVPLSALTGDGVADLMPAVFEAAARWERRIGTGPLNRWLDEAVTAKPPPSTRGRPNRLRYITQPRARPPTFAVFASRPDDVPESYVRYLTNALRARFELPGVPIRLSLRKGRNPYAPLKRRR